MKGLRTSRSRTGGALWWLENRRRSCTNVDVVPQAKRAISELLMFHYRGPRKQVYVEGRTRHSNDINVQDVQFLGQRGERSDQETAPAPEEYQEAEADGDLPFWMEELLVVETMS